MTNDEIPVADLDAWNRHCARLERAIDGLLEQAEPAAVAWLLSVYATGVLARHGIDQETFQDYVRESGALAQSIGGSRDSGEPPTEGG